MARTMDLLVNGVRHTIDAEPDRTLLTVLRDELELTGTKYGCGEGQCGACTVMLEDRALRSCQTKVSVAVGKRITTIEGLEQHGRCIHCRKRSWSMRRCSAGIVRRA